MSRLGDTAGTMSETAEQVKQNVSEKAAQVGQNIREMGSQARDVANRKYEELRDSAADYYQQGKERAQEWEHGLEQYVQEKPLQAVLIAAGIGVVLGLLWKRH
jgi:ElaB/YqjD/DUF883 family membrane-anchored ribosome-binding protein